MNYEAPSVEEVGLEEIAEILLCACSADDDNPHQISVVGW